MNDASAEKNSSIYIVEYNPNISTLLGSGLRLLLKKVQLPYSAIFFPSDYQATGANNHQLNIIYYKLIIIKHNLLNLHLFKPTPKLKT
jgi:hypothetical protein